MSIKITNYENVAVLTLKDDLAGDTVEVFNGRSAQCLEEGRFNIVVDCSSASGFDSAGLEVLLDLQNKCEDQLGAVKLYGLDQTCTTILEITRLARRFEIFADLESAVKSFG
jgi:anti-anti-sigma factor